MKAARMVPVEEFTTRTTLRVTAMLKRAGRVTSVSVVPREGESVPQFAARVLADGCDSIAAVEGSVIELRVVAEGEGGRG